MPLRVEKSIHMPSLMYSLLFGGKCEDITQPLFPLNT